MIKMQLPQAALKRQPSPQHKKLKPIQLNGNQKIGNKLWKILKS